MIVKDKLDRPWDASRTVDPQEVARFTALAEEWWRPDGRFRPIHRFNATQRDFIVDRISRHFGRDLSAERPLAGLRVVDIGCGAGLLCEPIAEKGADVLGIDASARNIAVARRHAEERGLPVRYRHCLAEHLLEAGEGFDVVLNTEVVEHVADQEAFIAQCSALVKPGGLTIVATLNRTLISFMFGIVAAERVLRWLPKGTHDWQRFVRPAELARMLQQSGLQTREVIGVTCNPITRNWRISRNSAINYMLLAERTP
jgi:2-polyprenyl-6-hydroxyphenyl methylase/3-demethylubiquinone-9 3-methyltransferase